MGCVDLNCDLGESFGAYTIGLDAQVIPHVSSVMDNRSRRLSCW